MWGAPGPSLPRTRSARAASSANGPHPPGPPRQLPLGRGAGLPRGGGGPLTLASIPFPRLLLLHLQPLPRVAVPLLGGSLQPQPQPWEALRAPVPTSVHCLARAANPCACSWPVHY